MSQCDTVLDVVDRLTIEHPYRALIDGQSRWVRRDPLIRQLREAIASSLTGGNGTKAQTSSVPFDTDAAAQYDQLEGQILASLSDLLPDRVPELLPEQNLRAWYAAARPWLESDAEAERLWYLIWSGWEERIAAKLEPPIVLELIDTHTGQPYDCPDCGGPTAAGSKIPPGWFQVVLNSGPDGKGGRWHDKEQRVKLTATYRSDGRGGLDRAAVECGCCGWRVTGVDVRGFAWDLEQTPTEGTNT